jgi:opacity protein-like surface antigen
MFGFTLGAGGRWYFYKNLGLQIEWSFVKSYYAKDWRNRGIEYDYHTKLSINRFSLGLCAKL